MGGGFSGYSPAFCQMVGWRFGSGSNATSKRLAAERPNRGASKLAVSHLVGESRASVSGRPLTAAPASIEEHEHYFATRSVPRDRGSRRLALAGGSSAASWRTEETELWDSVLSVSNRPKKSSQNRGGCLARDQKLTAFSGLSMLKILGARRNATMGTKKQTRSRAPGRDKRGEDVVTLSMSSLLSKLKSGRKRRRLHRQFWDRCRCRDCPGCCGRR